MVVRTRKYKVQLIKYTNELFRLAEVFRANSEGFNKSLTDEYFLSELQGELERVGAFGKQNMLIGMSKKGNVAVNQGLNFQINVVSRLGVIVVKQAEIIAKTEELNALYDEYVEIVDMLYDLMKASEGGEEIFRRHLNKIANTRDQVDKMIRKGAYLPYGLGEEARSLAKDALRSSGDLLEKYRLVSSYAHVGTKEFGLVVNTRYLELVRLTKALDIYSWKTGNLVLKDVEEFFCAADELLRKKDDIELLRQIMKR